MVTAGVDCGAGSTKAVIVKEGKVAGKATHPTGIDSIMAADRALDGALEAAGLTRKDVGRIFATGTGRKEVAFAHGEITEVEADARGIASVLPLTGTVIDVGAEEGRAVRVGAGGTVADFVVNEKCASGAGIFMEIAARALETEVAGLEDLYFRSAREVSMNAQCVVFAESELVNLVHSRTEPADIAAAVLRAVAERVGSMMRRIGPEPEVAAIGGVSRNRGFIDALEREMRVKIAVPEDPEFVGALGAALAAAE